MRLTFITKESGPPMVAVAFERPRAPAVHAPGEAHALIASGPLVIVERHEDQYITMLLLCPHVYLPADLARASVGLRAVAVRAVGDAVRLLAIG